MGSGSSKSAVVTQSPQGDPHLKGILKQGGQADGEHRENIAWDDGTGPRRTSTPELPPRKLPATPGLYPKLDDDDKADDEGMKMEDLNEEGDVELVKDVEAMPSLVTETAVENVVKEDGDSASEGSTNDSCHNLAPNENTAAERLEKLTALHESGAYHKTEFSDAKYKVYNDYLTWATETGSRDDRAVVPDENMQLQQMQRLRDMIQQLQDATTFTGVDELNCLLELCKMSDVRRKDYVDLVTELAFAKLFRKIWDSLHQVDVKDQLANPAAYLAINLLLDATQGFTEMGSTLCRDFGQHCVDALLRVCDDPFYYVEQLNKDGKKLRWMSRREFLKRVLTVLYHTIRHYMDNKTVFRSNHASNLLKPYLKCRFLILRVKAIFTLAFIVTENENAHLNTTNTNIDFIIKILSKALNEPNHYSAHYNFSAIQVADAMKYIAANDDNKLKFVASGALSRIVSMMQADNPLEEQRSAIEALWILSFHHDNKNPILKEKGCIELVRKFSSEATLKRPCEAILWNVGEETHATLTRKSKDPARRLKLAAASRANTPDTSTAVAQPVTGGDESKGEQQTSGTVGEENNNEVGEDDDDDEEEISTNHVMLSYQWDVQKQMLKVKELLQADGYKVWMDVDQMGGSTLEAMASAVENAAVVLICFSEKYKDSPACRTEAEYTFKLNRPIVPLKMQSDYNPDGWLGIMLGTKYYIQMSTMDEVIGNVDRLKRELASRGRLPSTSLTTARPSGGVLADDGAAAPSKFKRNGSKRISRRESAKDVSNWSNDDVNSWLAKNGLAELKNRLAGYDGEGIMGLKTIASDAPEFFYKEVKTELGLKSLREIIRFKQALDDIL